MTFGIGRMLKGLVIGAGLLGLTGLTPAQATLFAGTVILEGSDAIGNHSDSNAAAATYRDQAFTAIGGPSGPIGVVGTGSFGAIVSSHPITDSATVAGLGPLSAYTALYFIGAGGCCVEDDASITAAGATAAVTAYLSGGGTVMIGNYTGGAAWDFAVPTGGAGNAHVAGVGGGFPSGLICSDGETVTTPGTTNGFTQPSIALSCWTHQGYDQSFFGPLGFTNSFYDSPLGLGIDGFSSLLAHGVTVSAPEPASVALLGAALIGMCVIRRRRV